MPRKRKLGRRFKPDDSIPAMGTTLPLTRTGGSWEEYEAAIALNSVDDRRSRCGSAWGTPVAGGLVQTRDAVSDGKRAKKKRKRPE